MLLKFAPLKHVSNDIVLLLLLLVTIIMITACRYAGLIT